MKVALIGMAVLTLESFAVGLAADDREMQRAFAEGGEVRLSLASGDYTLRAGAADRIVVRWRADGEAGAKNLRELSVDVHVTGTLARIATEGPAKHVHVTIEIPARSDVHLRMKAGDLAVEGVDGNKDIRMVAGDLNIEVRPSSLARAHASVTFGDLEARPLGISKSGIKRSLDWTGAGRYALDARLLAGDLTLTHPR
jgi:hypothetical protein